MARGKTRGKARGGARGRCRGRGRGNDRGRGGRKSGAGRIVLGNATQGSTGDNPPSARAVLAARRAAIPESERRRNPARRSRPEPGFVTRLLHPRASRPSGITTACPTPALGPVPTPRTPINRIIGRVSEPVSVSSSRGSRIPVPTPRSGTTWGRRSREPAPTPEDLEERANRTNTPHPTPCPGPAPVRSLRLLNPPEISQDDASEGSESRSSVSDDGDTVMSGTNEVTVPDSQLRLSLSSCATEIEALRQEVHDDQEQPDSKESGLVLESAKHWLRQWLRAFVHQVRDIYGADARSNSKKLADNFLRQLADQMRPPQPVQVPSDQTPNGVGPNGTQSTNTTGQPMNHDNTHENQPTTTSAPPPGTTIPATTQPDTNHTNAVGNDTADPPVLKCIISLCVSCLKVAAFGNPIDGYDTANMPPYHVIAETLQIRRRPYWTGGGDEIILTTCAVCEQANANDWCALHNFTTPSSDHLQHPEFLHAAFLMPPALYHAIRQHRFYHHGQVARVFDTQTPLTGVNDSDFAQAYKLVVKHRDWQRVLNPEQVNFSFWQFRLRHIADAEDPAVAAGAPGGGGGAPGGGGPGGGGPGGGDPGGGAPEGGGPGGGGVGGAPGGQPPNPAPMLVNGISHLPGNIHRATTDRDRFHPDELNREKPLCATRAASPPGKIPPVTRGKVKSKAMWLDDPTDEPSTGGGPNGNMNPDQPIQSIETAGPPNVPQHTAASSPAPYSDPGDGAGGGGGGGGGGSGNGGGHGDPMLIGAFENLANYDFRLFFGYPPPETHGVLPLDADQLRR